MLVVKAGMGRGCCCIPIGIGVPEMTPGPKVTGAMPPPMGAPAGTSMGAVVGLIGAGAGIIG